MENKENIFNTIERYLDQEMTSEERTAFEQELKHNTVLQKQYERHVAANELLLERRLLKIRAKTKAHTSKKASSGKTLLYGTVVVCSIALISTIFFFTTSSKLEEKKDTIIADSIVINTAKQSKENLRASIIKKDSSAYDTLVKAVQKRDKTPESHVDVIYKKIKEKELSAEEKESIEEKVSTDSAFQHKEKTTMKKPLSKTDAGLEATKKISCDDYVIRFELNTRNSCIGKESGSVSIQIDNQKTAPYKTHIVNEFNKTVSKDGLPGGSYSIYITDKNNCKSNSLGFFIEEEFCLEDYLINSSYNEKLRLPEIENSYQFRVYDKAGRMYYEKEVQEYEALEWNGSGLSEEIVPGYYLIHLELENGTVKKGSITIKN